MTVDMKAQRTWNQQMIAAPVDVVFDIVADPRRHHEFDGSGSVSGAKMNGPDRLSLGAKFGMKMKIFGIPYLMNSTVKEFEENFVIAWAHFGGHRWRYEFAETDGGTLVTETFDWSTSIAPSVMGRSPYPRAHDENIKATLLRLEALATA